MSRKYSRKMEKKLIRIKIQSIIFIGMVIGEVIMKNMV